MVIVGAGECGARAASALREAGFGGPVTLIGSEPRHPYERPPLSKEALTQDEAPSPKWVNMTESFADRQISCLTGTTAVALDRQAKTIRLSNGATLAYDRLLLATGAVPRRLPMAEAMAGRVAYLRTFEDAIGIRRHLLPGKHISIIGGGFIGLELAASARQRGADVTIVEAQPRILTRGVPEEIANVVAARHVAEGARLLCGHGLSGMVERADGVDVVLWDGQRIEADVAVIGIGAAPVTGLAEAAGLALENGVAVDECLRTSDPDIFAAGDCCSFPLSIYQGRRIRLESWRNAQDQGALAARNMLGAGEAISSVPWFWSDQYDLTLQIAGLSDGASWSVRRDLGGGAFILFHFAPDGRLLAASGIGPGSTVARDIRVAEMLIDRRARPEPEKIAAPEVKLKALLTCQQE